MHITATLIIIVLTCIISLVALNQEGLMDELSMYPYVIKQRGQYYRFLTHGFVHANYIHLFFNMYSFYWVGQGAEQVLGLVSSMRYLFPVYYALGLIIPVIPYYIRHRNEPYRMAVGASGAVSACIFTLVLFAPWEKVYIFMFGMPLIVYGIAFLAISAYMASRDSEGGGGIAHGVHFWGAVYGFIFPIIVEPALLTRFVQQILAPIVR